MIAQWFHFEMAKIAFISHWSGRGGAEKALLDIMRILRDQGHEPLCVIPKNGGMEEGLKLLRIPYFIFHFNWWTGVQIPFYRRLARTFLQPIKAIGLALKLKKYNPDIVYTNTVTICVGCLAAIMLKRPHVWHLHEFPSNFGFKFDLGLAFSLHIVDKFSSRIIAVSHSLQRFYSHFIKKEIDVIYQVVSNIEISSENSKNKSLFEIGIIGSIMPSKGQSDAVKAMAIIRDPSCRLNIVGSGLIEDVNEIIALVEMLKLKEFVKFYGSVKNPFAVMSAMDVILICSDIEAFGRVTAEAMSLGKAIVGTNTGATAELLIHRVCGMLYTPKDVKQLASYLKELRDNRFLIQQFGEAARNRAKKLFSENMYSKQLNTVITEGKKSPKLSS